MIIIIMVEIGKTTTGTVYKYILINANLRWDYWKSREDIKRMIRIVERLSIYNDGYDISDTEFNEIASEKVIPRAILDKFRMVTWYPYDFDGSFNERINELEYEKSEVFQESLKNIDEIISEILEDKIQKFRNIK